MKTTLTTIIFSILLLSCQAKKVIVNTEVSEANKSVSITAPMQQMRATLTKLLPIVIDSKQYDDPGNKAEIDADVKKLYKLSKDVVQSSAQKYADPSLRFISTAFSAELRRAESSLDLGKREFARYTLMEVTSYCIECHTRTSSGPSFHTALIEKTLTNMSKMERGEYLLSTRQFDRAFSEFERVIKDDITTDGNLFELDRAVRYALSISIKFQQNPKKSMEIAKLIAESDNAPYYLKQSARSWIPAIAEWGREKPIKTKHVEEILRRSENLIKAGHRAQSGMADRGGDVYFLRALSLLHLVFTNDLNREQLGAALYLMGVGYEAVRDLSIWSLSEDYFESCVRQVPHSKWSQLCYKRLEESVYFGYTGSGGVHIPIDVHIKLQELQKLALPDEKVPLK